MLAMPRPSTRRAIVATPGVEAAAADDAGSDSSAGFDWAWYEAQLTPQERRRRGHYSTPPDLVARMLRWVGYYACADLEHLTLLDPSCGSGNFLAAAAQILISHGQILQWTPQRILAALQANLWGLETDPVACTLAGLRLQSLARRLAPRQRFRFHIHQADALALAAAPRFQVVVGNPPYLSSRKHDLRAYEQGYLSGGQRDAYLLFLEQACRFVAPGGWLGLVLPDPVLARANAADARRLLQDLFSIQRLLHLKGVFRAEVGTLVLIAQRVPAQAGASDPREERGHSQPEQLAPRTGGECGDGGPGVPAAACEAQPRVRLSGVPSVCKGWSARATPVKNGGTANRSEDLSLDEAQPRQALQAAGRSPRESASRPGQRPASLIIPASRFDWRHAAQEADQPAHMFAIDIWKQQPQAELRYLLGPAEAALFDRLGHEIPAAPLGDLVAISRGEEMARGAARPLTQAERSDEYLPALRGGLDVRPFRCHFAGVYLHRSQVAKLPERYRVPKLLVVKSTAQLCAALDEGGYVAFQTLYLLHLKSDQVLPEYLLALLNSPLLRGYLWLYHTAYKLVQPQIEQEALARVPLPLLPLAQQRELATLAGQLRACYQDYDRRRLSDKINSTIDASFKEASYSSQPAQAGFVEPLAPPGASLDASAPGGLACENEAAWIQLQQRIRALVARLDGAVAALCGLTPAEQALLARVPLR